MWPHDTAEAEWLAVGVQPHKADTTPKTEKAAALTATVKNMSDIAIPAPANSNAPTQRGGVLRRIINGLRAWQERLDARDTLHSMSDRELADIGLTRGDIDYVTAKRASTSPVTAPQPVTSASMGAGVMGGALMGLAVAPRGGTTLPETAIASHAPTRTRPDRHPAASGPCPVGAEQ